MGGMVHLAPGAATFDANRARGGINMYPFHTREVDDQAIIAGPQTRAAVSATSHSQWQLVFASDVDRREYIGDIHTGNDQRGMPGDHAIVDSPGVLVASIAGAQQ